MYDFKCEHCDGTVKERPSDREAIRHKGNFVVLESVPIGVCDSCGNRYFDAATRHTAKPCAVCPVGRGP